MRSGVTKGAALPPWSTTNRTRKKTHTHTPQRMRQDTLEEEGVGAQRRRGTAAEAAAPAQSAPGLEPPQGVLQRAGGQGVG